MLISEIYRSDQGEGLLTGTPSVFVRTSGCNLRCDFCDTPFASWNPEGRALSVDEIVTHVLTEADGASHVVLTGGEPMLPRDVEQLCSALSRGGFHITIETAGTIDRDVACDLMSISPKLTNSDPSLARAGDWRAKHQQTRHRPEIVRQLVSRYSYQLKFVVDQESDLVEVEQFLAELEAPETEPVHVDRKRVLLMPEGIDQTTLAAKAVWLEPLCARRGFTFCPRKHIEWYGNRRGT